MAPQRTDNLVTTRVQRGRTSFQRASWDRVPGCRVLRTLRVEGWEGGGRPGLRGPLAPPGGPGVVEGWQWLPDLAALLGLDPLAPGFPPSFLEASQAAGLLPLIHSRIAIKAKNTDLGHSLPACFLYCWLCHQGQVI